MDNDHRPPWLPGTVRWRYTKSQAEPAKMSSTYRVVPWYSKEKNVNQPKSPQKPAEKHVILMPRRKRTPPPRIEHDYLYIRPRKLSEEELYQRFYWGHPITSNIQKNLKEKHGILNLTVDELAARRRRAIAEEALKKQQKQTAFEKMNEPRYIELGFLLCSLSPEDLGILSDENIAKIGEKLTISPEKYVSNLGKFCTELTNFLGYTAKGTIFSDGSTFASSLSQVYRKAFERIDYRLEKEQLMHEIKVKREEQREQSKLQKLDDRYISIGRAICSLKPELFFPTPSESPEFPEEDDPEDVAYRGEELLENVFDFCDYVGVLMESHAKWTIFRSPAEFTHIFCNVAEKSVRDRRRKGRKSQRMA